MGRRLGKNRRYLARPSRHRLTCRRLRVAREIRELFGDEAPPLRYRREDMRYLFDERNKHVGYVHEPTGLVFAPSGAMSWPETEREMHLPRGSTQVNKSHAARLRAADRLGLVPVEDPAEFFAG